MLTGCRWTANASCSKPRIQALSLPNTGHKKRTRKTDETKTRKPGISIILESNSSRNRPAYFVPGQTISGRVELTVHDRKDVDAINIVLQGKCFTDMVTTYSNGQTTQQYHHIEGIPLFHHSDTLFRGPYTMQSTELSFPFRLTLPKYSNYVGRERKLSPDTKGSPQVPQPLPPSVFIYNLDASRVSYSLVATLNPASLLRSHSKEMPIYVTPASSQPLPTPVSRPIKVDVQSWKSRSLYLQRHTLTQKMAHIFTSNSTLKRPSITFCPKAYMPSSASIDQYLPLAVSIRLRAGSSADPENPTLILMTATLRLKQYNYILASHHCNFGKAVVLKVDINVNRKLPLDGTPIELSSAQGTSVKGASALSSLSWANVTNILGSPYGPYPPPSFSTYTIKHSYKMSMVVVLQHPKNLHKLKFKAKTDFKLLPPFMGDAGAIGPREVAMDRVIASGFLARLTANYDDLNIRKQALATSAYRKKVK